MMDRLSTPVLARAASRGRRCGNGFVAAAAKTREDAAAAGGRGTATSANHID